MLLICCVIIYLFFKVYTSCLVPAIGVPVSPEGSAPAPAPIFRICEGCGGQDIMIFCLSEATAGVKTAIFYPSDGSGGLPTTIPAYILALLQGNAFPGVARPGLIGFGYADAVRGTWSFRGCSLHVLLPAGQGEGATAFHFAADIPERIETDAGNHRAKAQGR